MCPDNNSDKNMDLSNPKTAQNKSLDEEYLNDFLIEAKDHLDSIEMNLLSFRQDQSNDKIIDVIFRDFHTIKGLAGFVSQSTVQKIAHRTESLLDRCRRKELELTKNLIDLILKSADYIKNICENLELNEDNAFLKKVSEHFYEFESLNQNEYLSAENTEPELRATSTIENDLPKSIDSIIDSIIGEEEEPAKPGNKQKNKNETLSVRIPIHKLDTLVEMIGELVINHSQFEQQAQTMIEENCILSENLNRASRLTKDIQNLSMSMRLVSLKSVFQRIYRIGMDTIQALGKQTQIVLLGEDTEIDRSVVEKLLEPLTHLIKNSIYHGIEDRQERIKCGKSPEGKVTIEAYSAKGYVYIKVSDDGRGIDTKKVLQKAIRMNVVESSAEYTDEEILEFVFLPGLSTEEIVNEVSGRGVGLDVVKTQITKMGGKTQIKSTQGQGCSFIIKMPINLSIIKGTIVEIAGVLYIIPTLSILTILEPKMDHWVSIKGANSMVQVREEIVPLVPIDKILGLQESDKLDSVLVVLESDQKLRALPVERVVGNRDIVIKSLGADFESITYTHGATILGNGKIAFIFDVENLFQEGD